MEYGGIWWNMVEYGWNTDGIWWNMVDNGWNMVEYMMEYGR